ncbi:MAG TPA: M23 family metallopeptidase [Bacteroidales bacterium]|nr:M23 family metallopeptidase [Bacteroidales bacterium]
MLKRRNYVFDHTNLQFLQHRRNRGERILRFALWFSLSIVVTFFYSIIFHRLFGSPKEEMLRQQVEELKLRYTMLEKQIDYSTAAVTELRSSDNTLYRAVLDMPAIPADISEGGSGGTNRLADLTGYLNSDLLMKVRSKFDDLKTQTNIQYNSLAELTARASEWKEMWEHLPYIRPVNVTLRLGDSMGFREKHPVLGSPRWHFGQDFCCPIGTEVHATGAGVVAYAGNQRDGFGIKVVIDHGYGYRTIYGHLSEFNVRQGQRVTRGDFIGLSGNTGTSTGPHLHYQIDLFGAHVNPLWYFQDNLTEEEYFMMLEYLSKP